MIVPDEAPVDDPATEDVAVKHDAGKERLKFRDYTGDKGGVQIDRVRAHYTNMRKYQCVEFVDRMKAKVRKNKPCVSTVRCHTPETRNPLR